MTDPFRSSSPAGASRPGAEFRAFPALLDPVYAADDRTLDAFSKPAPDKRRRSQAIRVFVGGGLDNRVGHNTEDMYQKYTTEVAGPAEYYTHLSVPSIVGAIRRANEQGVPIDLIGHSYGGMAIFNAVQQAADEGLKVRTAVTADPVGYLATRKEGFPAGSVGRWVSIVADPPPGGDFGDWVADSVARVGGKPSAVPSDYADQTFVVPRHHEELEGMLRDAGVGDLLRQLDEDDADASRQPIDAWMRDRDAHVRHLNGRQR